MFLAELEQATSEIITKYYDASAADWDENGTEATKNFKFYAPILVKVVTSEDGKVLAQFVEEGVDFYPDQE
jgi:hypothetical protein